MILLIFCFLLHGFKYLETDTIKLGKSDCSIKIWMRHTHNAYNIVCFNSQFYYFVLNKQNNLFSLKRADDVENNHDISFSIFGM